MTTAEKDIASFTSYVRQKIEAGGSDLTIDELFDQWRMENPSDKQYAENVAAIKESIRDYKAGDRGTVAGELSAELRRKFAVGGQ